MSSHNPFAHESVDSLIRDALQGCVMDAEPSPDVWEHIEEKATTWAAHRFSQSDWRWSGFLIRRPQTDGPLRLPSLSLDSVARDLASIRLTYLAGLIYRFTW
jgi:hypothetical protein